MVVIGLPATAASRVDARARRLAVDEHRARAALPFAAAVLAAGQVEVVAQDREQAVARLAVDLVRPAVDAQAVSRHEAMVTLSARGDAFHR